MTDMVNSPPHYQHGGVETIDYIRAVLGRDGFVAYCRGQVLKYASREKWDMAEDLRKAAWYANRAADEMAAQPKAFIGDR
jgi:hypothetical protein